MSDSEASEKAKISYISSEKIICPICERSIQREELHGGRGRIVVDTMTDELRHIYKPSEKYGIVNPLLYPVTVCPNCTYAAFKTDFNHIDKKTIANIKRTQNTRVNALEKIFPRIDFLKPRGINEGIASYYYAMLCYQYWPSESGPTIKQALSTLRIAWLCCDLYNLEPRQHWDTMARVFYRKARYSYRHAWEQDQEHAENIPIDFNLGPDTDKNYGINGARYLTGYLEYRWGPISDPKVRIINLQRVKAMLGFIVDTKRNQKAVPPLIITQVRALHKKINEELRDLTS